MRFHLNKSTLSMVFLIFVLALAAAGCGQAASPILPTATSVATQAAPTPVTGGTSAPAATAAPAPAATSQPATAATPAANAQPTAAPAASGLSASDLIAKARGITEYSFEVKMTTPGQTLSGKTYVKGTKMRQEMSAAGINTVTLIDLANKVAYVLLADKKTAMKMDFSQAVAQGEPPAERVSSMPSDAKQAGTETVDGKSAAVYEIPSQNAKYWIWIDRGLPLKVEVTAANGKTTMEFLNYQFGPLADSLFELPAGTQVVDIPTGLPGAPGGVPGSVPGSVPGGLPGGVPGGVPTPTH